MLLTAKKRIKKSIFGCGHYPNQLFCIIIETGGLMSELNNLKGVKRILKNGNYIIEYTFDGGLCQKIYNDDDVIIGKTFRSEMKDGSSIIYNEIYTDGIIEKRTTVYTDKKGQKVETLAFFDNDGFCTHIYTTTKENNSNVEYHYDLRGYNDTKGEFFNYAPASKIINKGLPIEERIYYKYNDDDTVTEIRKNAAGDDI